MQPRHKRAVGKVGVVGHLLPQWVSAIPHGSGSPCPSAGKHPHFKDERRKKTQTCLHWLNRDILATLGKEKSAAQRYQAEAQQRERAGSGSPRALRTKVYKLHSVWRKRNQETILHAKHRRLRREILQWQKPGHNLH